MGNYLIGIGGTGARCVEAITHLASAGLLPEERLYTFFVDPDRSNGNLNRAQSTLNDYVQCQELRLGKTPLFRTPVRVTKPNVWSPFGHDTSTSLSEVLGYDMMRTGDKTIADLFDVLYSEEEKTADLGVGFRGHPSIGAAVFAHSLKLNGEEPWRTFRELVEQDVGSGQRVRIYLMGSIFGGTGASGVPTIAQHIRHQFDEKGADFAVGSALALPYFNFSFKGHALSELKADSSAFISNTKAALKYYHLKDYAQIFDRIYVLGNEYLSQVENARVGGRRQENEPHFIEMLLSLSAVDFFSNTGKEETTVSIIGHADGGTITWRDLPYSGDEDTSERFAQLTRFSFAFLSVYSPAIEYVKRHPNKRYAYPWFVDFFEKGNIDIRSESIGSQLERLSSYCERFLRWIVQIHLTSQNTEVDLISHKSFSHREHRDGTDEVLRDPSDFQLDRFGDIGPNTTDDGKSLHLLWEYLCRIGPPTETAGLGGFVQALYNGCQKEVIRS